MKKIYFIFSLMLCIFSFVIQIEATATPDKRIIIDPGHGGRDGGASANGLLEAEINLEISLRLKSVFEEKGYTVDLTREDNNDLCDGDFIKRSDMNQRVKKINSGNYLCCISIHQNTFSDSKYRGAQTFYSDSNSSSKELALNVQNSIKFYLNNTTRDIVKRTNVYLLNKVSIPAILIECGFLTNAEEAKLLKTYEYQKTLAYSIYYGCVKSLV